MRSPALLKAVQQTASAIAPVAALGVGSQAVSLWLRAPTKCVLQIERISEARHLPGAGKRRRRQQCQIGNDFGPCAIACQAGVKDRNIYAIACRRCPSSAIRGKGQRIRFDAGHPGDLAFESFGRRTAQPVG